MAKLIDYLPDADALTALAAEDLGMILLDLAQAHQGVRFTLSDFEMPLWNANIPAYPYHKKMGVGRAIAEAWQWLQNEGLIMIDLDQPNGWFCLTRNGASLKLQANIEAYRHGNSCLQAYSIHGSQKRCGRCSCGVTMTLPSFKHSRKLRWQSANRRGTLTT